MRLEALWRDLKYSVRTLSHTPRFSLLAVFTLALGIGANVAVFSIVYGILFRPLPYRNADRLVLVQREQTLEGTGRPSPLLFFNANDTDRWIQGLQAVGATALYSSQIEALSAASGSDVIDSAVVSASFFPTLSGPLAAGRGFDGSEENSPVAVVSERLGRALFGSPAAAIGRGITLSSRGYTVIGVADRRFQFPSRETDAWLPARLAQSLSPRCCGFRMIGRLTGQATIATAAAEASGLAAQDKAGVVRATVLGLSDQIASPVRPALLMLLAGVAVVLLVSCANVVNLLLTRRATRDREFATRWALGASRGHLVRHAAMDAVVLAAASAITGVILARATLWLMIPFAPPDMPRLDAIHLDLPVLAFSLSVAVVASLVVGLPAALRSMPVPEMIKGSSGGPVTRRRGRRLTQGLSVAQLALSLVLLVSTSLLGRSFIRLLHTDIGVVTDRVATASLNFGFGARVTDAQVRERVDRVVARVRSIPGVTSVGIGTAVPPHVSRLRFTLRRAGDSVDYAASGNAVTPEYFQTLGFRLLAGRFFTPDDAPDRAPVMIMSNDTARRFFGDGDVVGRTMTLPVSRDGGSSSEVMTLVGIVSNVKYSGLDRAADDVVYRPFSQQTWVSPFLVVRTSANPGGLLASLRREIAAADRDVVLSGVRTLDSIISEQVSQPRFRMLWLLGMSGVAIVTALTGLYGVVACAVSQRTREIGIRVALGASSLGVTTMILREGLWLAVLGVVAGTGAAFAATRGLRQLLYGIEPGDLVSFAIGAAGLLVVSLIAAYIPARRATKVDPIAALHCD